MKLRRAFVLLGCLTGLVLAAQAALATPPPAPVEDFFAEDDIRSVQISPDGKTLAFLTTLGHGKVGIAIQHLDTGKIEPLVDAKDENFEFFFWKGSDRIVFGGDVGGNESASLRSIGLSKRKVVELAQSSYRENVQMAANWAVIMDRLPFDSNRILVLGPKSTGSWNIALWYLDVRTGERRIVGSFDPKEDTQGLVVDSNGVIRARDYLLGDKDVFEVRPDPNGPFVKVAEFPVGEAGWEFAGLAADNETLYLLTNDHTDTNSLQTLKLSTRQLSPVLFNRPDGEISSLLFSADRRKFLGLVYTSDKDHYYFVDQGRANLQATIDHYLPKTQNHVISRSEDEKVFVVAATSDRDPGTYHVLDLRKPSLTAVGKVNRRINPEAMRPMEPVSYQARDGLTIHGYLTRPAGFENKPAPLIINPHGGPYGIRDDWGFNDEVQFLANRGYAVLQINYRGSGGYGHKFMEAGKREWGGKMQDDLTDGVQWAIAQGIADPDRVAIYGGSYGGYAALAGVTFTPELYRCAVNYVGVSDLGLITSWARGRGNRGTDLFYREWVGDDKDYKFQRSPVNFVDRIQVPTLHAYGYNDPRVDIKHWTRLEPQLKKFNKPYEIIIEKNEGHGFRNEGGRIAFYRQLETFLAKHMIARKADVKLHPVQTVEMPAKAKTP